jgi:hypothetical protein
MNRNAALHIVGIIKRMLPCCTAVAVLLMQALLPHP